MASRCQSCGEDDKANFVVTITGAFYKDLGYAMVAGVQEKRSVRVLDTATLKCTSCQASWDGYVEDGYFYPDLVARLESM